jgi:hypothetical protein
MEDKEQLQLSEVEKILGSPLPANGQLHVEIIDDRPKNDVRDSPFRVTRETKSLMVAIKNRMLQYW